MITKATINSVVFNMSVKSNKQKKNLKNLKTFDYMLHLKEYILQR